ncbi:MAG: hypothetical protein RL497_2607, partial [Pseudomonadota bacterium]
MDKVWVEAGLKDADALFTRGSVLAIEAMSLMDTYSVDCGEMPLGELACDNGLVLGWSGPAAGGDLPPVGEELPPPTGGDAMIDGSGKTPLPTDATNASMIQSTPTFATTFADMIHPEGSVMSEHGQGIWMSHSPMGEVYAYIQGSDEAGLGATGQVSFFVQKYDASGLQFIPLKTALDEAVKGSWEITQPYEANGQQLLMIKMPEYLRNTFGADENDGMFLAVINDSASGKPILRIGHYQAKGRIHREAGLNMPALVEAQANFDYDLPPDADGDGVTDERDAFPNDATEQFDRDGDGVGDHKDRFPDNSQEQADTDHDGMGDNIDSDDDNDGIPDATDTRPTTPDKEGGGTGPVPVGDVKLGEGAFATTCESCHGSQGKGGGLAPALFPLQSTYPWQDKKLVLEAFIGPHINKPEAPMVCDQTCALNITAYLRGLQGNGVVDGDYDHDGILDSLDDDDDNDGIKDSEDPEHFSPNKPLDSDQDGTPDDKDAFPLDPKESTDTDGDKIGNNADEDDDGDGTSDSEDEDDDNDGIKDSDEEGEPTPPMVMDHDGDGIADWDDNCLVVSNSDQADSDSDGLGDACTLDGSAAGGSLDMEGTYLVTITPEADSQVPDASGQSCVADLQEEVFWVDSKQMGSQVFIHRRHSDDGNQGDDDEGIWVILDKDAAFTLASKEDFSLSEGEFDAEAGEFSFTNEERRYVKTAEGPVECVSKAQVVGKAPESANEKAVLDEGVHWIDGDLGKTASGEYTLEYSWSQIKTGAPESIQTWDASSKTFVPGSEVEQLHFLTAEGLRTANDLVSVQSFGEDGEGALLALTWEGLTVDFGQRTASFEAFDLGGKRIETLVHPTVAQGIDEAEHFPEGAKAYEVTLTLPADSYQFRCAQGAEQWLPTELKCHNFVTLGWGTSDHEHPGEPLPPAPVEGETKPPVSDTNPPVPPTEPVPGEPVTGEHVESVPILATQLDELINTYSELDTPTAVGFTVGSRNDYPRYYTVSAYLASLHGTVADDNLMVVYRIDNGSGNTETIAKGDVRKVQIGETTVLELGLPEAIAALLAEDDDDEGAWQPILFSENSLGDGPMVRHGRKHLTGSEMHGLVFNSIAMNTIVDGFSPKLEGNTRGDFDGDGIPDYMDNDDDNDGIPDDKEGTTPDMSDSDKDGIPNYMDKDDDNDGTDDELDTDDDNDGIPDDMEGGTSPGTKDSDGDGTPDYMDKDDDNDGTDDELDTDDDNDGIPDDKEGTTPDMGDSDKDGIPNYMDKDDDNDGTDDELDTDDDNDGIPDDKEGGNTPDMGDSDKDGIPNYMDKDDDND